MINNVRKISFYLKIGNKIMKFLNSNYVATMVLHIVLPILSARFTNVLKYN